jgi:protein-S-isoprenylcysteine O-methyltransferase Ste14
MQAGQLFDSLPLWGVFGVTVLVVSLSVEGGFRLGRHRGRRPEREEEAPVGSMVGATLGLLAFILAFTFGMAASRFDTRKELVLDEANAIGTTYLRAELLPEPERTQIRNLLREYVDVRLPKGVLTHEKINQAIVRSEELQGQLWSQAVVMSEKTPNSVIAGLFIQSLNEVIDLHSKRVTAALRNRIPGSIWVALYFVAVFAMVAMGYHTGLTGRRSLVANIAIILAFSAVILLIADLDRPGEGVLKVSQQSMLDLQRQLHTSPP